jgi:hypothetical protein
MPRRPAVRVDRDIDREETAVAAVSARYRSDNVFRGVDSPYRLLPTCDGGSQDSSMHLLFNNLLLNII